MSTLPEILHYLDTTARVSCPSITCEQAAEIAAMLRARNRELMDVHDALHRECDGNADLPAEIRALRKEREELADERDKILGHFVELTESRTKFDLDCWVFQQAACGFAFDAGLAHVAEVRRLERDLEWTRNSEDRLDALQYMQQQVACGFAWDAGREIGRLDGIINLNVYGNETAYREWASRRNEPQVNKPDSKIIPAIGIEHSCSLRPQLERLKESDAILLECVADLERDKERRERIDAGLSVDANTTTWEEATGDLDPGVYEGTGKGFEE